jgi:hypothetical protein
MNVDYNEIRDQLKGHIADLEDFHQSENKAMADFEEQFGKMRGGSPQDARDVLENLSPSALENAAIPLEDEWFYEIGVPHTTVQDQYKFAQDVLENLTIAGTDGSRILRSNALMVPMALVRAAGVVMRFDPQTKPRVFDSYRILSPRIPGPLDGSDARYQMDEHFVSFHMARLETEMCRQLLRNQPADSPDGDPILEGLDLLLFDNTFLLTFIEQRKYGFYAEYYYDDLIEMIHASAEDTQIPIAGIVDSSAAKEMTYMVRVWAQQQNAQLGEPKFPDAVLLGTLVEPFGRTCVFQSKRRVVSHYKRKLKSTDTEVDYRDQIGFFYTRVSTELPLRVEFPLPFWRRDPGFVDWLHKIVVSLAIIGNGYPRIVDDAHHAATLSTLEGNRFWRMVQDEWLRLGPNSKIPVNYKNFRKQGKRGRNRRVP